MEANDGSQTAVEEDATIVFNASYSCLVLFDNIQLANESYWSGLEDKTPRGAPSSEDGQPSLDGLRNSFILWADYTGALSLQDSSLDARLQGYPDVTSMILELLEMVSRNLNRLNNPSASLSQSEEWNYAITTIDEALDRLHTLATAIRKASAKRLQYDVNTILKESDSTFHRDAVIYVRWKFPDARKALCAQLGDSIAIRRRMLQQKLRHAQKLTKRRPLATSLPMLIQPETSGGYKGQPRQIEMIQKLTPKPSVPSSAATKASRPLHHELIMAHLKPRPKPTLSSVRSLASVSTGDSVEYPRRPKIQPGQKHAPCPYCLTPLESSQLQGPKNDYWHRHVDQDLQPYVCLFSQCAKALVFFSRQQEWREHMEGVHSKDWPRSVHTLTFYCDMGHELPLQFQSEDEWFAHMENLESHPGRFTRTPTKAQLSALVMRKQQSVWRDIGVCPLCESIPKDIEPLVSKLTPNDLLSKLTMHIAHHVKSLSLMSMPCLDADAADDEVIESSFNEKETAHRLLHTGSVPETPSQPSGLERISALDDSPDTKHEFDDAVENLPQEHAATDCLWPDDPWEIAQVWVDIRGTPGVEESAGRSRSGGEGRKLEAQTRLDAEFQRRLEGSQIDIEEDREKVERVKTEAEIAASRSLSQLTHLNSSDSELGLVEHGREPTLLNDAQARRYVDEAEERRLSRRMRRRERKAISDDEGTGDEHKRSKSRLRDMTAAEKIEEPLALTLGLERDGTPKGESNTAAAAAAPMAEAEAVADTVAEAEEQTAAMTTVEAPAVEVQEEETTKIEEDAGKKSDKATIKFKDAVGRKFIFPFQLCTTWQGMEDLIKQAFMHVDVLGPHVQQGHYDLSGPDGEVILPSVWETVIQPDWSITMTMWPIDFARPPPLPPPAPPSPPKPRLVRKPPLVPKRPSDLARRFLVGNPTKKSRAPILTQKAPTHQFDATASSTQEAVHQHQETDQALQDQPRLMDSHQRRHSHASADGNREVVLCHACSSEWYRDERGLICPDCQSEATEIIDPENDPRQSSSTSTSPEPTPRRRQPYVDNDSDPNEDDIEEHRVFHPRSRSPTSRDGPGTARS